MEINSVESLLSRNDTVLSRQEQIAIKEKGRPTPDLVITCTAKFKSRTYDRSWNVNKNTYDKYEWLCGCPVRNRVFCFTCLIFRRNDATPWTRQGVDDIKHLAERAKEHEKSVAHLNAHLDFNLLGKLNIRDQLKLNSVRSPRKFKCNEEMEKNRRILYRLIKCIKFCGAFELIVQNRDERSNVCTGLVNFAAQLDSVLATDLKYAKLFDVSTETIQNGLLDAMLQVYRTELLKQLGDANFISIQADVIAETSLTGPLMVLIVRYVLNGEICERFWSFISPRANQFLEGLLEELKIILNNDNKLKLVAQCYNDALHNCVHHVIKKSSPNAHFVHCYAHQFNVIVDQAVQCHRELKIFFAQIQGFSNFFSHQDRARAILDKAPSKRCNFECHTVNTVFEYQDTLREYLEKLLDTAGPSFEEIHDACCLLQCLTDSPEFLYWLDIMRRIMPHVETLFYQARECVLEEWQMEKALDRFQKLIGTAMDEAATGRDDEKHVIAMEACNSILNQINERFKFRGHLNASQLFFSDYFKIYREEFPKAKFDAAVEAYPMLDGDKLKSELIAIYQLDDMGNTSGVLSFLTFIEANNLKNVFSETYKLADIVCTTPMATSEQERCFSTLERAKTFLRNTVSEDKLDALAVLSIEKKFIQSVSDFDNKVIDVFEGEKDRTMELVNEPTSSNRKRAKLDEHLDPSLDQPEFAILDPADSEIKIEKHELEEEQENTMDYDAELSAAASDQVKEEVVDDDATVNSDSATRSEMSQPEARHPIQTFFDSMATTVIQFPPPLAVRAKVEVLQVVSKLELEAWDSQSRPNT